MKIARTWRRSTRLALTGGLLAAVTVLGVACSSDEAEDEAPGGEGVAAAQDDRGYAEGHRLVTGDWVLEHLDECITCGLPRPAAIVVDLRSAEDYAAGHIPGAVNIPSDAFSRTDENGVRGQIALAEDVALALGDAGITPESIVVFYDGGRSTSSARALWVLDVYGHAETRILDGGWALWTAENRETSTEPPTVAMSVYAFASEPNTAIIAGYDELVAAINDPEKLVCDVRSAEEYAGRDVRAAQGGHVPGAVNEDFTQAIDENSRFRSAEELRDIYGDTVLVSDDEKTVYVYCQTGVRAAHTWFTFHDLLGLDNVKNYDGSWEEYGNRPDAVIERS